MKKKPTGHYIVKENNKTMVAWYADGAFFKAGSATPYTSSHFDEISEVPLDLDSISTVKGTKW